MISLSLVDDKTGDPILELRSPVIPPAEAVLRVHSSHVGPSREFYVVGVLDMDFSADGSGPLELSDVTLSVQETLESRQRQARRREGRTAG